MIEEKKGVCMGKIAVALVCVAALIASEQASFAQAGSTGGTLGKTDKSASGGEQQQSSPQKRAGSTAGSRSITGEWSSQWAVYHLTQSGKSFTWAMGNEVAHGTINGDEVRASWSGGIVGTRSAKGMISKDGNTIMWDNGTVFTRK
jgi:hypothetical protein